MFIFKVPNKNGTSIKNQFQNIAIKFVFKLSLQRNLHRQINIHRNREHFRVVNVTSFFTRLRETVYTERFEF